MALTNPLSSFIIVGCGKLGTLVGSLSQANPVAETLTTRSHPELTQLGLIPRIKSQTGRFDHVLFAVPPSNKEDYLKEIRRALTLWSHAGAFVFISSTAVYREDSGKTVTETSALADSPRAQLLIEGEKWVLAEKGTVLRLAGLYHRTSGPHIYYSQLAESPLRGDGLINLIHYEDAASLTLKLFHTRYPEQVFLGSDNSPICRNELVQISQTFLKQNTPLCRFLGSEGPLGKKVNNDFTRKQLDWSPTYSSFQDFARTVASIH
ncbi:MAG: hypothetical protein ACKOA8_10605 [Deltaproteobacteria bacterium]